MSSEVPRPEPIAIVGSACRFAGGVDSSDKLWELLRQPRDVRSEITNSRFNAKGFYHTDSAHHGHMNVLHSYLLDGDVRTFDAEFFGINPIEARAMDPQQRLLLEIVYEAIESGGFSMEGLRGSDTSVFAGLMCGDYEAMMLRDLDQAPTHFAVGTSRAVLSNRLSYFFDWHGASVTVDTACSSSLVAVHQAVQALRAGDSTMAVACGSNLILGPEMYILESKLKMLSPDGLSRMWDKDANGYARGDGVAAVVLKTLSRALADGDKIEAVIRETGVNQDGATPGLTMPSASAQRALIQSVYKKSGLDPQNPAHRPQYIEAHGTGTPAGDPVEAEALSTAFFSHSRGVNNAALYTGSIKTVLGHTEGTAGIAGLLKVTKALQNSTIPPNLWFNQLSPSVAPFYGDLQIPTEAQKWPEVSGDQPRRASVNNFGFGGTNAHAIIESYDTQTARDAVVATSNGTVLTPFVFSAASAESLRANLTSYVSYLETHPETNIHDLAYTLRARRSVLPFRVTFSATNLKDLKFKIQTRIDDTTGSPVGVRTWSAGSGTRSKILGVFTGQGAQYARMGAELIEQSSLARRILQTLEDHLASLPEEDRPNWSLRAELLADPSVSRVGEATISQPLCTAVQIIIVDLLRSANVHLETVVGHSSGEIAAAYAAGFLSARDALLVAYYRGLHCKHAASPNGDIKGAMLAAGTSLADATELCEAEEFAGRVSVAAINSSSSVTISGDEDAVDELALILSDENKFNRRLKVDTAYHSSHMLPCFVPYVTSLRRAGIKALSGNAECTWHSSVYNGRPIEPLTDRLDDEYWANNMTMPVTFSDAVHGAVEAGQGGSEHVVALEIGPHPALAGPASQNIQDILQRKIPYHGTLSRGGDAAIAFSTCLGFLWTHLDSTSINLDECEVTLSSAEPSQRPRFTVLHDLPSYQWKHEAAYWAESRRSRRMRLREEPYHQLLGNVSPDSAPHALRWKNVLKPREMTWLEGHQVQNQVVLPAAAYVSTAIEAAKALAGNKAIHLIELSDFHIHNAIMFDQNDTGVEIQVELSQISVTADHVMASFTYSSAMGGDAADLVLAANGGIKVILGDEEASLFLLPERHPLPPHMIPVTSDRLYDFMDSLEYDFSGPFRSLVKLERNLGNSACVAIKARVSTPDADALLIHPVDLDAAFQSIMLAYSYPGDDRLRLLHLPTSIRKLRINPALLASEGYVKSDSTQLDSTCSTADDAEPGSGFSGSVNIYAHDISHAAVQVDQVTFKPVGSDASNDRDVFYKMHWVPSKPDGVLAAANVPVTKYDHDLMFVLSRIAAFYLRTFDKMVPEDDPARSESPLCHYLNYARHMTNLLERGEHKWAHLEWLNDTEQDVLDDIDTHGFADNSDVRIMLLVGQTMPRVFKGETTMLEHFRTSGLLDEYYSNGFGTKQSTLWVASVLKQLTDRNPHLSLLEIGAGTGGATKTILQGIGHDFDNYTFTDISSSFFENAAETFSAYQDRMVFKVCNAENDPGDQGFQEGTYDVVIAFMVVHACARLDEAVLNLRKLLKPGGLLVLGEGASDGAMQAGAGFIFGTLPGWWRGVDEGRTLSPLVNTSEWEVILKGAGFSGIDTMSPPQLFDAFGITLFVSTAIDERIEFARNPLSVIGNVMYDKVVLIGGQTPPVAHLVQELQKVLVPLASHVLKYQSLEDLDETSLDGESVVISLVDLEHPVFKDITSERWYKFRKLFETKREVLWLTSGRLEDEPYCNMTVGFGRSAMHEESDLRVQYVDIADVEQLEANTVADYLLKFTSKLLDAKDILYTKEPEIIVDTQGRELVPRLFPITDANDRLNSVTRPISRQVDISESIVELNQNKNGPMLRQLSRYETSQELNPQDNIIKLYITHSVTSALKNPAGYQFLALARDESGAHYIVSVSSLTSVVNVPRELALPCTLSGVSEASYLTLVAAELIAKAIVDPLFSGQSLVVHNASNVIAQAINRQSLAKGVIATFIADSGATLLESSSVVTIKLPLYLGRSEIARLLPVDVACFAGFSTSEKAANEQAILACLPPYCRKESMHSLFAPHAFGSGAHKVIPDSTLEHATTYIKQQTLPFVEMISLETVLQGKQSDNALTIVDWTSPSPTLPAQVTRLESKQLFKGDKTYWLVGLSGALGISLCDWMIERGVRYLVLTSRNPKIDPRWIENHRSRGVVIEILLCDVTDERAIKAVHQNIVDTLPPIVGLLNGAMVLRDVSVPRMEFEHVTDVIRPKVLGSIHLDRIFHDVDLDFFVLLSSINCVIGNVGQANYAAANMGMVGVAGNRRKRGLRSSVVNVGAIIGVGYITQSDRQLDVTVAKTAMMHLSEQDFHQIFAECMEAGHLDNPNGPEISTGLLSVAPESINIPPWYSDPKFARFRIHQSLNDSNNKKEKTNAVSIQSLLQACKSQKDTLQVVQQAFGAQLRRILQVSTSDDDLMMMRGVDLGFDSLLSVDVRSWFLKNFQVSIPVLKIMANDVRMSSLAELAVEGIPTELIPHVPHDGVQDSSSDEGSKNSSSDSLPITPSTDLSDGATTPPGVIDDSKAAVNVDWDLETSPPVPDTIPLLASAPAPKEKPEVVVLTGCSGLLGHHLLNTLIEQSSIRKIICIAVRRLSERLETGQLPPPSDRIVYYEGDLTQLRLGLSEDEWINIFSSVDAVIHNGSDTSHLKYYSALRQANVESTKQLVRTCLQRMIPLHYVSSAGVALFAELEAFPPISCTTTGKTPPADGSHGYMCGKWVCESLLERVHAKYGLRIVIQRPSTIIRAGSDAEVERASFDWVNALLHYVHKTQKVPRIDYNAGAFDLVSIETCVRNTVEELLRDPPSDGRIVYVNSVGDEVIPMASMANLGLEKIGKTYDVCSMEEWTKAVVGAGMHPAVAALIETFDEPGVEKYPTLLRAKDK
ncbi:polyketide synthase PksF [Dothidotthia symphoricarpi CBS 119687]|uniref:Polyketide synthase PksF n=1 Tax=Dothidotthia symphoricarpi CBS 119687 TaxID=1392245 RepID=A0A6A6AFG8_9PLEO|nr:polyketide synthase PksF [Dothidotthia symphoricarpi CBS 119687]KAF2129141.1 polyketide synthase PksF [Dothidotthia symphoricarpi CBS 119687]